MTKTTDSRQIRLLIDGVLSAHGIDDLTLSIHLTDGIKRLLNADLPVKTREDYLDGLKKTINKGAAKHERLQAIADEINRRTKISPVSPEWLDFIEFVHRAEQEKAQTIARFLDWWLSDEWNRTHMPSRPTGWRVKWDMAFISSHAEADEGFIFAPEEPAGKYVPAPTKWRPSP